MRWCEHDRSEGAIMLFGGAVWVGGGRARLPADTGALLHGYWTPIHSPEHPSGQRTRSVSGLRCMACDACPSGLPSGACAWKCPRQCCHRCGEVSRPRHPIGPKVSAAGAVAAAAEDPRPRKDSGVGRLCQTGEQNRRLGGRMTTARIEGTERRRTRPPAQAPP